MFNLNDFRIQQTGTIQIKRPDTGEDVDGLTVEVIGRTNKEYERHFESLGNALKELSDNTKLEKDEKREKTFELESEFLAKVTVRINGAEIDGKEVGDDKAVILSLYNNKEYLWLRDQVNSGVFSTKNFLSKQIEKKAKKG